MEFLLFDWWLFITLFIFACTFVFYHSITLRYFSFRLKIMRSPSVEILPYPSRSFFERRRSCDSHPADRRGQRDRKTIDVAGGLFREWVRGLGWEVPHSSKLEASSLCFPYFTAAPLRTRVLLVQPFDTLILQLKWNIHVADTAG